MNPQQLTPAELADLKAEMQRDGLRMRDKLQAMKAATTTPEPITLPLELPIWVNKGPLKPKD